MKTKQFVLTKVGFGQTAVYHDTNLIQICAAGLVRVFPEFTGATSVNLTVSLEPQPGWHRWIFQVGCADGLARAGREEVELVPIAPTELVRWAFEAPEFMPPGDSSVWFKLERVQ